MSTLKIVQNGPMTHQDRIQHSLDRAIGKDFQGNRWGARHVKAWQTKVGSGSAIVTLIEGMAQYADSHHAQYGAPVGEDYVLGDEWEQIARAVRGLLNGERGDLDGNTVDTLIADMLRAEGFDPDVGGRMKGGE